MSETTPRPWPTYDLNQHIRLVSWVGAIDSVVDQREVTVQSYQTSVPFDFASLTAGVDAAWLSTAVRFGVIQKRELSRRDEIHVILGLQGELSVRAFDVNEKRPLYFSWQDAIVDTVAIRYYRDENGALRFTTFGGGARISDEKLFAFNQQYLKVPKESVSRRQFDLDRLRQLCFDRFSEKLYMLRFSIKGNKEYRSIDKALFRSRRYIEPDTPRFREIREDENVLIESFDSDVDVETPEMSSAVEVRFMLRGTSGALRLAFPRIAFKKQFETVEEQVRVFYNIVDTTVKVILDGDYYARRQLTLEDLRGDPEFPELADFQPHKVVLSNPSELKRFFDELDLSGPKTRWLPHLRAVSELVQAPALSVEVATLLRVMASQAPGSTIRLINVSARDAKMNSLAELVAGVLSAGKQRLGEELRLQAESALFDWAIGRQDVEWDVDLETERLSAAGLQWSTEELSLDALVAALGVVVPQLHRRLREAQGDCALLLAKYNWCVSVARKITKSVMNMPAWLRLIVNDRVPKSLLQSDRILQAPVRSWAILDDHTLNQFGLALWPFLKAEVKDSFLILTNDGLGAALNVRVTAQGATTTTPVDLPPDRSCRIPWSVASTKIDVRFEKYEGDRMVSLDAVQGGARIYHFDARRASFAVSRKSIERLREVRKEIDKGGIVIGPSIALLKVFEDISLANATPEREAVLLEGEQGVGKTHFARIIHESSRRSDKVFLVVNAGGGGGDLNIQRGEWIGFGKNHGVSGVQPAGKPGHLVRAQGGSLFVDEFAAFSHDLQVIFLSVLEAHAVEKVGGESYKPDVRCILATNANVDELVRSGRLRSDLVGRITYRIRIPALRERLADVIALAHHFAKRVAGLTLTERCKLALLKYDWPGNVREVEKVIQRAASRATTEKTSLIDLGHLDLHESVTSGVKKLSSEEVRQELWSTADRLAAIEGYDFGEGRQRQAGEILGVGESAASKAYEAFGLSRSRSA